MTSGAASVSLCALLAAATGTGHDESAGWVTIDASTAEVTLSTSDGSLEPERQMHWSAVIKNALPVAIHDIRIESSVVRPQDSDGEEGGRGSVIHDWREGFVDATSTARWQASRSIMLPDQDVSAHDLAYRLAIVSFRIAEPHLDVAIALLKSPKASDQRSALLTYEGLKHALRLNPSETASTTVTAVIDDGENGATDTAMLEVERALRTPRLASGPDRMLRLLVAVHAAGLAGWSELVRPLLSLPGRLDDGSAESLVDLVDRIRQGSDVHAPRLALLPSRQEDIAPDASIDGHSILSEVVSASILRMGDRCVPALIRAGEGSKTDETARRLAAQLLHTLGRFTIRQQLAIANPAVRADVMLAYVDTQLLRAIPHLVEIAAHTRGTERDRTMQVILQFGSAGVRRLLDSLGHPDVKVRATVTDALQKTATPKDLVTFARAHGLRIDATASLTDAIRRVADHLAARARAHKRQELDKALEQAQAGDFDSAFLRLDRLYRDDPELYMERADAITKAYLKRAEAHLEQGNYDAAIETARIGISVRPVDALDTVVRDARLKLAQGYFDIDDIERSEASLDGADAIRPCDESRRLRALVLRRKAELALLSGNFQVAREHLERARALLPSLDGTDALVRELKWAENIRLAVVLAVLIPVATMFGVLWVRRKRQTAVLTRASREPPPVF